MTQIRRRQWKSLVSWSAPSFVARSRIAVAALTSKRVEIARAARTPEMKSFVCPMSEPNSATPSTLPVCRDELRTPAATPERDFSTLPSSAESAAAPKALCRSPFRSMADTEPNSRCRARCPTAPSMTRPISGPPLQRSTVRQIAPPGVAPVDSPAKPPPSLVQKPNGAPLIDAAPVDHPDLAKVADLFGFELARR
jgi:hypothetical protein